MPITQYIGARYVPIIYQNPDDNSNDWKAGVPYEPLTIVSYAGGSYTSKSAVPAGASNPVDAPEYWVSIGLYSGQTSINTNNIDHIQHALANATEAGYVCTTARAKGDLVWINGILYECTSAVNVNDSYTEGINITQVLDALHALVSAIDQATSDVSDLANDLNTLDGTVTTLSGTVGSVQTQSNGDHSALTSNQIKKVESVVWIGDSYTSAGSLGADVDKRFSTLVSNQLGLIEHNYAEGGTGYCYGPTPYTTQVTNAITDFTSNNYDETAVKYVFVMGNRNDGDASYTYSQYSSAVGTVFTNLTNFFVNAKIIVIPALWDWKMCTTAVVRYATIINEIVQNYTNVIYFSDAFTWLTGHADEILWQAGADVHPNVAGHRRIASRIMNALEGNNYNEQILFEFAPTTTHSDISNAYCCIKLINGIAYFQFKFKTSNASLGGDLMTYSVNNLAIRNIFMMDTQVYTQVMKRAGNIFPKVTVNQAVTKTGDNTGSFLMNVYCYNNESGAFDTSNWNWIEVQLPYGIKRTTYN